MPGSTAVATAAVIEASLAGGCPSHDNGHRVIRIKIDIQCDLRHIQSQT
jgi:hypothetical protein